MQLEFLDKLLGEGNYHWVYALKNQPRLAIKIAKENTQQLAKEAHILSALQHTGQFPKIVSTGSISSNQSNEANNNQRLGYMVIDRLGVSLEELLKMRKGKLALSTIKNIGLQLLNKLSLLHSLNIVHNDIKPSNVLFGTHQNRTQIFLVDFGFSSMPDALTAPQDNEHSNTSQQSGVFRGNPSFSSLNRLKGGDSSKIDDLQSVIYVLFWMLAEGHCEWKAPLAFTRQNICQCFSCQSCLAGLISKQIKNKQDFVGVNYNYSLNESSKQKVANKLHLLLRSLYSSPGQAPTYSELLLSLQNLFLDFYQ